jgi:hypothetical protein
MVIDHGHAYHNRQVVLARALMLRQRVDAVQCPLCQSRRQPAQQATSQRICEGAPMLQEDLAGGVLTSCVTSDRLLQLSWPAFMGCYAGIVTVTLHLDGVEVMPCQVWAPAPPHRAAETHLLSQRCLNPPIRVTARTGHQLPSDASVQPTCSSERVTAVARRRETLRTGMNAKAMMR